MIPLALVPSLIGQPSLVEPARTFAAIRNAHAAASRQTLGFRIDRGPGALTVEGVVSAKSSLTVRLTPRAASPASSAEEFARVLRVDGNRLEARDDIVGERIARALIPGPSLYTKLSGTGYLRDDVVEALVSGFGMQSFLGKLAVRGRWRREGRSLVLGHSSNLLRISFDDRNRLTGLTGRDPDGAASFFRVSYPPARNLMPTGRFREVGAFSRVPRFPLSDRSTRAALKAMVRATGSLTGTTVAITNDDGAFRLWIAGNRVRQRGPGAEWAYDGKRLYIRQTNSRSDLLLKPEKALLALTKLTEPLTGLARDALGGSRLFAGIFGTERNQTARFVGTSGAGPQAKRLIEIAGVAGVRGGAVRTLVTLRADNLPEGIDADTRDANGKPVLTRRVRYLWNSLTPPPPATFRLP